LEPVGQERRGLLGDAEGEADAIGAATLDRAAVQMHECTGATASIALLATTGAPVTVNLPPPRSPIRRS